jgi:hypothetical protein
MPEITNANLTLSESENQVTIRVRYDVTFSPFERTLADLGLNFHTHTSVHGIDGATVGGALAGIDFGTPGFAVTAGSSDQLFHRDESRTVSRTLLQEDPVGDPDELKVKIRVHSPLPAEFVEEFTDQETLSSS